MSCNHLINNFPIFTFALDTESQKKRKVLCPFFFLLDSITPGFFFFFSFFIYSSSILFLPVEGKPLSLPLRSWQACECLRNRTWKICAHAYIFICPLVFASKRVVCFGSVWQNIKSLSFHHRIVTCALVCLQVSTFSTAAQLWVWPNQTFNAFSS